jgi:hypothetical protein
MQRDSSGHETLGSRYPITPINFRFFGGINKCVGRNRGSERRGLFVIALIFYMYLFVETFSTFRVIPFSLQE